MDIKVGDHVVLLMDIKVGDHVVFIRNFGDTRSWKKSEAIHQGVQATIVEMKDTGQPYKIQVTDGAALWVSARTIIKDTGNYWLNNKTVQEIRKTHESVVQTQERKNCKTAYPHSDRFWSDQHSKHH